MLSKTFLLTKIINFKEHVTKMLGRMFNKFSWEKSQLLYEKTFWETELREAGFCKLLMNVRLNFFLKNY